MRIGYVLEADLQSMENPCFITNDSQNIIGAANGTPLKSLGTPKRCERT